MVLSAGSIFILRKRTRELNGTGIYQMRIFPWLTLCLHGGVFFCGHQHCAGLPEQQLCSLRRHIGDGFFMLVYFLTKGLRSQHE